MLAGKSDEAWEDYGKNDPYFGVLTWEGYKNNKLTKEAQKEFFATGERYIDSVVKTIQEHFNPAFRPVRALDFGCGVGRLALPLARLCDSVVGVDVSESLLATAAQNCKEPGLTNVTVVKSDDALSGVTGTVDFFPSFLLFHHIPP